jgi:hypothetical protein
MTHQGIAPTRKNITVTIHGNVPSEESVKANAGNTITFINMDRTEKLLRFAVDENGSEFHPIGLMLAPGPEAAATIIAVDPESGAETSTAYYTISTVDKEGRISADPDDDTYQVIVGSSAREL